MDAKRRRATTESAVFRPQNTIAPSEQNSADTGGDFAAIMYSDIGQREGGGGSSGDSSDFQPMASDAYPSVREQQPALTIHVVPEEALQQSGTAAATEDGSNPRGGRPADGTAISPTIQQLPMMFPPDIAQSDTEPVASFVGKVGQILDEAYPLSADGVHSEQEKARFELAFMMDYYVPWLLEEDLVTLEDPLRACLVQLRQLWENGARDRQNLRSAMQETSKVVVEHLKHPGALYRTTWQRLKTTRVERSTVFALLLATIVVSWIIAAVCVVQAAGSSIPWGIVIALVVAVVLLSFGGGLTFLLHPTTVLAQERHRTVEVYVQRMCSAISTAQGSDQLGVSCVGGSLNPLSQKPSPKTSRRCATPQMASSTNKEESGGPNNIAQCLASHSMGFVVLPGSENGNAIICGMEHWGDAVGFMAVSPDGTFVLWSSGAEAHFLVPRASLVGRPVQDVVTITLDRGDRAALEFAFPGAKRVTVQATFFSGFFVSNESLQTTVYAWETGATRRDVVGLSALRCAELKGKVDVLLSEARKAGSSCRGAVAAAESVAAAIGNLSYDALREAAKASAAFAPVSAAYLNESLMSIRGVITVAMSTEVLTAYIDLVTLKSVLSEVVGKAPGHVSVSRVELVPAGGSGDPAVDVLDFTVSHEGDASVALSELAQRAVTFMAGTFESSAGQSRLQVAMFPTHAQRGFKRELVNGGQFAESAQLAVQPPLTFVLLENDSVVRATLVMRIWRCRSTVIVCYKPDEAMQLIYNHATHIHVVVVDMDGFSLPELDRIVDAMASHSSIMWVAASRCNRFPDSVPAQCRYSKPLSTEVVMTISQRAWLALQASQSAPSPSLQPAGGHSELNVMPYEVGLRLGKGATCDVFEASLPAICGTAALKRVYIGGEEGEARLQEARSEVAIIASLSHPNIVRYFFSSEDRQHLNIFVELCRDGSLGSKLRQTGAFGCVDAHECVMALLDVLAYMHSQNIVHRDLKPDNLLFRDGVLKLADFGSATKLGDSPLTDLSGTILYMAPEVLLQEPYRERCDIWSFGCVVADVLGVTLPHQRDPSLPSLVAAYRAMSSSDGAIVPDFLPADIANFLRSCLRRDPLKRPSALQLMQHPLMREAKLRGSLGAFLDARRGSSVGSLSLSLASTDDRAPRRVVAAGVK